MRQSVERNLSRHKTIKFTIHDYPLRPQCGDNGRALDGDKSVDHLFTVNHAWRQIT